MDAEKVQKSKRKLTGLVVSDKNTKTIVVAVSRRFKAPTYNKYIHDTKKYHAHDEKEQAKVGDKVTIIEARPHSRLKRWDLLSVNK